jgi:imidazolonepropionase-like amidohydrolase
VDEAQETAAQLIQAGVDQIGFVQSVTQEAGNGSHDGLPPTLSDDQLGAIVEVAHQNGVWVTGQAVFPDEAKIILDAGVDELANWPSQAIPIPDDLLQTLVSRSTPVVSGFNVLPPQEGDIRRFLDAGGMLVFGTYAPNSGSIHKPYREFQVMSLNDMTPMEMIQSATANAAYAVGLGDAVGTLEVGKQADVIVVDGDPFEDFRVMREEMVYVVKGGELVVQPEEA